MPSGAKKKKRQPRTARLKSLAQPQMEGSPSPRKPSTPARLPVNRIEHHADHRGILSTVPAGRESGSPSRRQAGARRFPHRRLGPRRNRNAALGPDRFPRPDARSPLLVPAPRGRSPVPPPGAERLPRYAPWGSVLGPTEFPPRRGPVPQLFAPRANRGPSGVLPGHPVFRLPPPFL